MNHSNRAGIDCTVLLWGGKVLAIDLFAGGSDVAASPLAPTAPVSAGANDFGELSANPYQQNSTANEYGAGSPFAPNGINNPFSPYGSPFSNQSARNPFATDAPRLYDHQGNYSGKLSVNPYDSDSTSNPYGQYGSRFLPDSINSPYGIGSPYRHDSRTNSYGRGFRIEGQ